MSNPKRPKAADEKPRRGRPKTSPLDPVAQVRERQRRHRQKQREQGRVAARLWIDRDVHAAITKSGQTLQEAADKAFALLMATMRKRKAR